MSSADRLFGAYARFMQASFAEDARRVAGGFWATLKRAAGRLPFVEDVVAGFYCSVDPATPTRVRAILTAALAYFVLPLDAVTDLLPLVGFTDDVAVLAAAIAATREHVTEAHRALARRALGLDRPDVTA